MRQRIGYARVSTDDQSLDFQLDGLHRAGIADDLLNSDTGSGKDVECKELAACLKALREGDTLVVWRLDRLDRSLPDLVRIVGELEQKGVSYESLCEKIETGSPAGKLVFHVFAALTEFERSLIRERTQRRLDRSAREAGQEVASRSWIRNK